MQAKLHLNWARPPILSNGYLYYSLYCLWGILFQISNEASEFFIVVLKASTILQFELDAIPVLVFIDLLKNRIVQSLVLLSLESAFIVVFEHVELLLSIWAIILVVFDGIVAFSFWGEAPARLIDIFQVLVPLCHNN